MPLFGTMIIIVFTEIDPAAPKYTQKPRTVWMYKTAIWEKFSSDLSLFKNEILSSDKDAETMWEAFTAEIVKLSKNYIKTKSLSAKFKVPWLTRPVKTLINK